MRDELKTIEESPFSKSLDVFVMKIFSVVINYCVPATVLNKNDYGEYNDDGEYRLHLDLTLLSIDGFGDVLFQVS